MGAGADSVCGEQVTGTGAWAWEGGDGALVVFLLGSMFEDAGKLHVVEVAFLINGCLAVHLVHFLICEAVAHGGEQLPEMVLMDETWARAKVHEAGTQAGTSQRPLPLGPPTGLCRTCSEGMGPGKDTALVSGRFELTRAPEGRVLQGDSLEVSLWGTWGCQCWGAAYVLL